MCCSHSESSRSEEAAARCGAAVSPTLGAAWMLRRCRHLHACIGDDACQRRARRAAWGVGGGCMFAAAAVRPEQAASHLGQPHTSAVLLHACRRLGGVIEHPDRSMPWQCRVSGSCMCMLQRLQGASLGCFAPAQLLCSLTLLAVDAMALPVQVISRTCAVLSLSAVSGRHTKSFCPRRYGDGRTRLTSRTGVCFGLCTQVPSTSRPSCLYMSSGVAARSPPH